MPYEGQELEIVPDVLVVVLGVLVPELPYELEYPLLLPHAHAFESGNKNIADKTTNNTNVPIAVFPIINLLFCPYPSGDSGR